MILDGQFFYFKIWEALCHSSGLYGFWLIIFEWIFLFRESVIFLSAFIIFIIYFLVFSLTLMS